MPRAAGLYAYACASFTAKPPTKTLACSIVASSASASMASAGKAPHFADDSAYVVRSADALRSFSAPRGLFVVSLLLIVLGAPQYAS